MKQKTFLFILFLLSTLTASAYDAEIDGIYYNLVPKAKQAEVTSGDTKYTGSVTIPDTFTHDDVTYSVTSIGVWAFSSCSGLTSVTIPNSVTSIGYRAFSYCSGLTEITIPNSVTSIGESAFEDCSGLTSVTIGNSVTSIGESAFYGCSGLTSVDIPNSVTEIGYNAFRNCSSLTSVDIPNSVTSIGDNAFYECSGLASVTIPNSVTSIGCDAFYYCKGLTLVDIPNSVTSIGRDAFRYCFGLTSVHITDISAWCKIVFSGDYSNPLYYAKHLFMDDKEITDLVIPNSVTTIGDYAFNLCSGLTSVTIPNSVTTIGNFAFSNCSGLASVTIPNSVTSIGYDAFLNCSGLTSVTIGNGVTSIGNYAFGRCSGLTSVSIGSGVRLIGGGAFAYCEDLSEVYCYALDAPSKLYSYGTGDIFQESFIEYATLYVPEESFNAYKTTEPWSGFGTIKTLSGDIPETPKCAMPTISYVDGELQFSCETEDVEYVYTVTPPSYIAGTGTDISISTTYKVTVYATKFGYDNSDVATKEVNVGGGTSGIRGDVNLDGEIGMPDVMFIVNYILNGKFPDE